MTAEGHANPLSWQLFELQRNLGKGSSGTAELVRRKSDGALLVSPSETAEQAAVNNEIQILTKLKHPNIVGYYGSFMHDASMHIVMEYADGGTLEDLVKQAKKQGEQFSEREVMTWSCQLVLALQYLLGLPHCILHRDIKQANVFLEGRMKVKLGDFGLARTLDSSTALAQTTCGTPYYLSPELCLGQPYNHKSDCWALGCLVYEMMTLNRPFKGNNLHAVVMKICHEPYAPLPKQWSDDLIGLVGAMLQKDPLERASIDRIAQLPFVRDFVSTQLPGILQGSGLLSGADAEAIPIAAGQVSATDQPFTLEGLLNLFDSIDDDDSGFASKASLESEVTDRVRANPWLELLSQTIAAVNGIVLEREEFEELVKDCLAQTITAAGERLHKPGEIHAKETFRNIAQEMVDSSDDDGASSGR